MTSIRFMIRILRRKVTSTTNHWPPINLTRWWKCGNKKQHRQKEIQVRISKWWKSGPRCGKKKEIQLVDFLEPHPSQKLSSSKTSTSTRKKHSKNKIFLRLLKNWLLKTRFRKLFSVWRQRFRKIKKMRKHGDCLECYSKKMIKMILQSLHLRVRMRLTPTIWTVLWASAYPVPTSSMAKKQWNT